MLDKHFRIHYLIIILAIGFNCVLQACGDDEAVGSGFVTCLTVEDGYPSCDQYCASISRACMICDCPDELKDNIVCSNNRQYSAFGWKSNAQCEGAPSTAYNGCAQSLFQDASGAVITASAKCCCE